MQKLNCFVNSTDLNSEKNTIIPIIFKNAESLKTWLNTQSSFIQQWITAQGFSAKPDTACYIPDEKTGNIHSVIAGARDNHSWHYLGYLAANLPQGTYSLPDPDNVTGLLFWGLGAYEFDHYKSLETKAKNKPKNQAKLIINNTDKNTQTIIHQLQAIYLVRDLINTPTEHMGPSELSAIAEKIALTHKAEFNQIIGDDLLKHNYPAIHAVGRACDDAPRLIDIRWGNSKHPKITLVGKGVCFDTGGLDLKPPSGMAQMKKDMAGSAHVLGLASLIIQEKLPVRLRVLIPAVENSVSGNAYRPGDIIKTRKGLNIEIGNTDAEGRMILADALTEACSENPELIIDFSTLTGAARVALGTEISALFCNNPDLAQQLILAGEKQHDPIWQLPLYKPYRKLMDSPIADMTNSSPIAYGGAITAALFLQEFIENKISWAHFDIMAWNDFTSPSRPQGGEAMGLRAVFHYLQDHFSARSSAG